eukprot:gb/GFBE01038799.1/.p1 GENE.gb/GFBE01038799.1/~~gb/GFBE01038799.1/.p1  ORF type:complete len:485 (+),score=104.91 gb/GFBE01038799.1/:1-1455(+)
MSPRVSGEDGFDDEWRVGSRYAVAGYSCVKLWDDATLTGKLSEPAVPPQTVVLLVKLDGQPGSQVGFVVPPEPFNSGWTSLEPAVVDKAPPKKKQGGCCGGGKPQKQEKKVEHPPPHPLVRKTLPGSWTMNGLYKVRSKATIREGANLKTRWIAEVPAGEEVLVLDMGVNEVSQEDELCRIRALVCTKTELVGWLTPETKEGEKLLDTVNLLSSEVAILHKTGLTEEPTEADGLSRSMLRRSLCRSGIVDVANLPWKLKGLYRTLEDEPLRFEKDLSSESHGCVVAGSLVKVLALHIDKNSDRGDVALASVELLDGALQGFSGWLRCSSAASHDVVDIRNLTEYHQLAETVRNNRVGDMGGIRRPSLLDTLKVPFDDTAPPAEEVTEAIEEKTVGPVDSLKSSEGKQQELKQTEESPEDMLHTERTRNSELEGELAALRKEMERVKQDMKSGGGYANADKIETKAKYHKFVVEGDQRGICCCGI